MTVLGWFIPTPNDSRKYPKKAAAPKVLLPKDKDIVRGDYQVNVGGRNSAKSSS